MPSPNALLNAGAEQASVHAIKPHPRNVNQGDYGAIHESMTHHGFYGRIVVNRRTGFIVCGNTRYQVARDLGYTELPVEYIDVPEEQELKILLVDNRTGRLGTDGQQELADLLAHLSNTSESGLAGTGFDGDFLDDLIGQLAGPAVADGVSGEGAEGEDAGENLADTQATIGPYRWTIKRGHYQAWLESIRQSVGFEDEQVIGEIKKRLSLPK